MRTLYVTRVGTHLRLDGETLVVECADAAPRRCPLSDLRRLIAWGGVSVTTPLLRALAHRGIDVALLTASGRFTAAVTGAVGAGLGVRLGQFRRALDTAATFEFARSIVDDKLASAAAFMRNARKRNGPEALRTCIQTLDHMRETLTGATTLEALRGHEGTAARHYFDHFGMLVPAPFHFDGRNRRPPRDPVNAALGFGYTLLANEVRADLEARGFDPRLGFLHAIRPGRPALALDAMEAWRAPVVDRLVLTMMRKRMLDPDDFDTREAACLFNDRGRRRFLDAWEDHLGAHDDPVALRQRIAAYLDGLEARISADTPP
ncbi:CRISPR-associated endonuclease Cas1 [Myxococcota bacterium]|nr:CRISPR-associated endonuclease Cas1 [Myxococcota bacterium]